MANLVFDFLHNYVTGERRASDPADAYQFDEGHVLEAVVPVAVTSCEIQYWIRGMEKADAYTPTSITHNTDNTYTILGNIPNSYFENSGDLRVYIVVTDGDASITTYEGYIHIKERQMPEDYVDDDPDNDAVQIIAAARGYAETSEAWAVGQINGEDVPSTADQYQNNASYYANQAASAASSAAAQASLAPAYDNTATYAVGDYCLHDGRLYECTTAITTAEAWTAAHWTAVTVGGELSNLKDDFSNFKTNVFDEEVTPSANLYPTQILTEGSLWNCWTATVYTESNNNYACFEFSIPEGANYISANYQWAENSYSAFVDNSYAKLDLIKNTKQSGSGYIYAIPQGTTKACVSFNRTGQDYTKYLNDGIVFIVGSNNITDKTKDDYDETKEYFADKLKLASENNETIPTVVDNLAVKIDTITDQFEIAKNLVTGINTGQYAIAWNIGDTVTTGSGENYAYGYADVEGCDKVTVNMSSMSDAYSFFTDADHKKVATSADNRIGTTRVYNVPTGAKYFYISSNNKPVWSVYGLVAFSGNSDIATNPASAEIYPYNVEMYYADGLKLSTGGTIGSKLENTGMVFHVEKDGSGDFTSFVEAIQEATKYMDSVVYVGAGEWDIIDEFGSTYMESVTSNPATWGIVLKNRVHVVGTAKTIVTAKYTGTTENTRQYFSAFNAGAYGFTLENLEIEADNIRYVIHDDRGNGGQTPYTNRYINCSMKLTHGYYGDTVLGGGLGVNGTFEIINCRFEGSSDTHRLAYYHGNNYGGETGAKCKIIVQGCYFAGNGSFDVTKYGDSTEMTTAYLSNNSFGSAPQVTSGSYAPQDNMQIVAWCNEIRS